MQHSAKVPLARKLSAALMTSAIALSMMAVPAHADSPLPVFSSGSKGSVEESSVSGDFGSGDELACAPQDDNYDFPSEDTEVLESIELDQAWSGMFVVMDLITHDDEQYVGYWDDERRMVVAHRTLGASEEGHSEWTHQVLDEDLGWDSHNYISLGIDRDGNLHASGNMHNDPMAYFTTSEPGDVTTLERQDYVVDASTEQSVTYPEFVNRQDGSLVFSYRDGASGDGVTYFNVYDESTGEWSRLIDEPLFDGQGEGTTYNSYFEGPELGPDGDFHLLWVWRETSDAATNSIISYAKSEDLVNWTDAQGEPLTTPFHYEEGDIVDPIPQGAGLLNGNAKIGFDATDDVVVTYHKYDQAGDSQLYAARPGGTEADDPWSIHQFTDWDGRWDFGGPGTLTFEIDMLGSEVLEDGNIQVNFQCFGEDNSIVVDDDLQPLAHVYTPSLADGLGTLRGDWQGDPGLQVNVSPDRGETSLNGAYILRWESLPENRDMAYDDYPQASTLEVKRIGVAAEEPEHAPWASDSVYTGKDLVEHEGRVFEALWWTQGQEPGAAPGSAWSEVGVPMQCDSGNYPMWAPSSQFEGGETVVHEGTVYTSRWYSRNQAPGEQWGPWEEGASC